LAANEQHDSRVSAAVKAGYLINAEHRQGCPLKISLGNPLPEDQELLPSVRKVALHHAARITKMKANKLKANKRRD
jgi:hypothetical protein